MNKDRAIEMRDKLEAMAKAAMSTNPDIEDHIISCCLAVAMEELEKWIYDDDWTPSVCPYIDNRKFEIPFDPETADDEKFSGPPWARVPKVVPTFEERFPTVARLRKAGKLDQMTPKSLSKIKMEDWASPLVEMFRMGDRAALSRALRVNTGASVKQITQYVDQMIVSHPDVWGIDAMPGDVCPKCGNKDIDEPQQQRYREYHCKDCGLQWGPMYQPW